MNRDEIVDLVLRRSGQRQNDSVLLGNLQIELPLIQERLEGGVRAGADDLGTFLPWFLIKESSTLVQAVGAETIAVPSDFLMGVSELETPTVWYYTGDSDCPWKGLTTEALEYLRRRWSRSGDAPKGYALVGEYLYLRPVPASTAVTIRLAYYGKDAALTDAVLTNNWTKHATDVLVAELLIAATFHTRDEAMQAVGRDLSKAARERLFKRHISRMESLEERTMGEAP
jgi:hypothetical protein